MSASKSPGRVIDGPYANFATYDENAQVNLAASGTLVLGQPLCLDLTNLGPDNNVPNNGSALAQCERLVATTNANAGPVFGIFLGFPNGVLPKGFTLTVASATNGGAPTYTNNSGASAIVPVNVRQSGWGYVFAGTAAASPVAITVGSALVTSTTLTYLVAGTATILKTGGTAIATAINTTSPTAVVAGAGRVVTPVSMVGITTSTPLLIDSLASGVQETVTPSAVSSTTFTATFVNGHAAGFGITGAASALGATLIPATISLSGLVAAYIETNV
jgi:hypothetical protein